MGERRPAFAECELARTSRTWQVADAAAEEPAEKARRAVTMAPPHPPRHQSASTPHTMDIIFLRALRVEAMVGIYRRERTIRQTVEIDLDIALPHTSVFASGKVADTIDYAVVTRRIREELDTHRFGLVENLAEHLARLILDEFHSPWVRLSVAKLGILKDARAVGVTIERKRSA